MASKSNESIVKPAEDGLETTTEEISITETTTNNTIQTTDGINYIITACTPKDMKDDDFAAEKPFFNWDTETEENLSGFHKSMASSEVTITDVKSEACDDTEEYMGEFYSEQVIQQNKMLSELNTACEGIFQLDRELSENESRVTLKTPLSEETSLSVTACPPTKVTPCVDYGFFVETSYVGACEANIGKCARKSLSNQTFVVDIDEEQTVVRDAKNDNAAVEHVLKKEQCSPKENENSTKETSDGNKDLNPLHFPQNSNACRGANLVHYTTDRLEDIARRNYEAARAVFKSKENECLQNASLEIAIKNIFNNKAETKNELEKAVNDEDCSVLYQSSTTNESQQSKRKESSISFDSWMLSQRTVANKKSSHSEYAMDSAKIRKTVKRPVTQVSDKLSLKQFVTPEGLEESPEKKPIVEDAKERGDELAVQKKAAVMSYEDLMRVLASPTSESSIFTDATKTKVADGLHSSPSDSRLLKSEQRAAAAAAEKKKATAPKVKNLEEELHYHNPFQAVFRRAGFTDVNQLYKFMDYECEEDLEELQKPLSANYIGDLIKKIQDTDKQIRAMHKEMFEGGFMAKLAPFFARCKKMRDEHNSEESDKEEEEEDEDEESSSEEAESADD